MQLIQLFTFIYLFIFGFGWNICSYKQADNNTKPQAMNEECWSLTNMEEELSVTRAVTVTCVQ